MADDFDLGLIGIPEDELDALLHDADDRAPTCNPSRRWISRSKRSNWGAGRTDLIELDV